MTKNAANAGRVQEDARNERQQRRKEDADLAHVLSSKAGRRFVHRLISTCGVFRLSYTGNADTHFNEGMRAIGLKALAWCDDADPEGLEAMLQENREDRKWQATKRS